MSSFYDDASLVVIPSGYKTSKVYAEKPTDGSGDLTFTRTGDTATRVNSAGLIEKVRTNVVTYSQDFSDASWTKTALTISTSATANPVNGALTAQDAIPTAVSSVHRVFKLAGVVSAANTWSVFAKAKGYNFITIVENGNTSASVSFNLSTGAVSTQISAVGQIQSLGNGWYRCSMIHTTSTTPRFDVYVSPTDSQAAYTGDGTSGVTLFGAQAEASDFGATSYIATTTAAVSVGPVANVPRLDYLGSTCPRLILEPQRQNLITFSEQLNNATWDNTLYPVTITANQTASPSGYVDADLLTPTAAVSRHAVGESASGTAGSVYTASAFFKKGGARYVVLTDGGDADWHIVTADLDTATITNQTNATGTITNYGNGWYRVTCTFTRTNTSTIDVFVGASNTSSAVSLPSFNDVTLTTFAWGVSLELGAYATSYIPTLASASTRSADACSKTGISSLIGQTQGTLFADFTIPTMANTGANLVSISLFNSGITNVTLFDIYDSGNLFAVHVNGTAQASIQKTSFTAGRHKVAFGYKSNDFVLYVDGVLVGTDTSGTVGAQDSFGLQYGTSQFIGQQYVNQALLFKTRLTNSELAELTSL